LNDKVIKNSSDNAINCRDWWLDHYMNCTLWYRWHSTLQHISGIDRRSVDTHTLQRPRFLPVPSRRILRMIRPETTIPTIWNLQNIKLHIYTWLWKNTFI